MPIRPSAPLLALLMPALLMASEPEQELSEVVVTASRTAQDPLEVPASVSLQDMDVLRETGFTYGSEEFRGVPGVFARRGEGDGDEFLFLSIRGSSGTEGYLAMIDGVPFLGPDEEPLLNQLPYDAIQRVEVVKGPVSALYGRGGLYGAVNYITRMPAQDDARVTLTAGEDDYYRGELLLNQSYARGAALFSAAYEDYGGWREHGGRQLLNLFGRGRISLTALSELDLSVNYFDRDSEVPNAVPMTPDGEVLPVFGGARHFLGYGDPRNRTEGVIASARLTHAPREGVRLSATAQLRRFDQQLGLNFYDTFGLNLEENLVGFNGYYSDIEQDVQFAEFTASFGRGRHNVVAGISGERARSRSVDYWSGINGFTPECGFNFYLIQFDYTTGENVSLDHPCFVVDDPLTADRFTNTFWGAFVQDEIQLGDRWRLTGGVRYDSFERRALVASPPSAEYARLSGKADALSPKAALSWLYDGGQVYFAYGRGFNSNFGTTFEWDALQYARPENRPSTLDSYELGWKGRALEERLQFELAVFHTEQTNRRQFVPNPDAEIDPAAPGSRIAYGSLYESRGLEASMRLQPWPGGAFTLQYSFLDPRWKDYIIRSAFAPPVDLSGTTPTGVARHIYYAALEQRFSPWLRAQASLEMYGDYQITQLNTIEDGGYALVSLGATLTPPAWRGVSVGFSLANALDEKYYFYFGNRASATTASPGVPRQLRVTLRATF